MLFQNKAGQIFRPNFTKFKKLMDKTQLKVGMVLIDKRMHKRTVLAVDDERLWLGHKGGYRRVNRFTGKDHPIDHFIKKYTNWIFEE